jgi:hypothetical protein
MRLVCAGPKERHFEHSDIGGVLFWRCTIHPKEVGDYDILVTGLPANDVGSFSITDAANGAPRTGSADYKRFPDGTLSISVSALTPQGIRAREWAWLQAVGAFIGILGTVLGYPFIKSRVENRLTRNSAIKDLLKAIDDNVTKCYSELVAVFTPYLHPEDLQSKASRQMHLHAAEGSLSNESFAKKYKRLPLQLASTVERSQNPTLFA